METALSGWPKVSESKTLRGGSDEEIGVVFTGAVGDGVSRRRRTLAKGTLL